MAEYARSVGFTPRAYEKREADLVLDKSFKEFGQVTVDSEKTVEQFFQDYEDLFYQIPVSGSMSHQYLVEKSSEMYKVNSGDALVDIQPLIDEITLLRSQSVVDQQTILDLQMQLANVSSSATG